MPNSKQPPTFVFKARQSAQALIKKSHAHQKDLQKMLEKSLEPPRKRVQTLDAKPSQYPELTDFFKTVKAKESDSKKIPAMVVQLKKDGLKEAFAK
jgi:rubrerythrin